LPLHPISDSGNLHFWGTSLEVQNTRLTIIKHKLNDILKSRGKGCRYIPSFIEEDLQLVRYCPSINKAFMDGAFSPAMAGSTNKLNYKALADS